MNTGTWADLIQIPPGLDQAELRVLARNVKTYPEDVTNAAPYGLRPFRRLTYVELQLGRSPTADERSRWSAVLRQWHESTSGCGARD